MKGKWKTHPWIRTGSWLCSVKVSLLFHALSKPQTSLSALCALSSYSSQFLPVIQQKGANEKRRKKSEHQKSMLLLNTTGIIVAIRRRQETAERWNMRDYMISLKETLKLKHTDMHCVKGVVRSWETGQRDEADESLFVLWCCVCVCVLMSVCVFFLTTELSASLTFDLWFSWPVSVEGTHSSGRDWSNNHQPKNWKTKKLSRA